MSNDKLVSDALANIVFGIRELPLVQLSGRRRYATRVLEVCAQNASYNEEAAAAARAILAEPEEPQPASRYGAAGTACYRCGSPMRQPLVGGLVCDHCLQVGRAV